MKQLCHPTFLTFFGVVDKCSSGVTNCTNKDIRNSIRYMESEDIPILTGIKVIEAAFQCIALTSWWLKP